MSHEKRTPPNGSTPKRGLDASWREFRKYTEEVEGPPVPDDPQLQAVYLAGYAAGIKCGLDLQRDLWDIVKQEYAEIATELNARNAPKEKP